ARVMALVPFPSPQSGALPIPPDEDDDNSAAGRMSFLEHLDELRKRIVNSAIAIGVCVVLGFAFINRIVDFILAPTRGALPPGVKMIYTEPGEAFSLYIQISLIMGVVLAAPIIMYQVWMFIAPGLYSNEKRLAIPFVLFTTIGFVAGAAFNHYIAFPFMMAFFASFNTPDLAFMPKLDDVFGLYTKMLLGMGIVFQMPTVVFFLAKMKLITARFLISNFKYAFLIIFVVAAVITPTGDMMTQTIFAAPMVALYLLSIGIAWVVGPKRIRAAKDAVS
ncbi:MAG TPA: twin-arginine translocase subunit TatC, partial [Vicinamibacterales bacterium]|nr:twin-arginine translocase subunit TatC [Vicinamibacterales bacterium]